MTSDDMARNATDAELAEMGACAHRDLVTITADTGGRRCYDCGEMVVKPATVHDLLAQPDVAPSPDVDAGGAGLDVYRAAAEAYDRRDDPADLEPPRSPDVLANHPPFRAAIDAARAPLLAELGEAGQSMYDYQHAATRADEQRDQARADRDVAEREMERYRQEALDLVAELAEAIRERDEARAKTEGGEWETIYAWHRDGNGQICWCDVSNDPDREDILAKRQVWTGPVEPVTDGEAAP